MHRASVCTTTAPDGLLNEIKLVEHMSKDSKSHDLMAFFPPLIDEYGAILGLKEGRITPNICAKNLCILDCISLTQHDITILITESRRTP